MQQHHPQHPRTSQLQFRKTVEQILNLIANNRAFSILALAYMSFFFRIYNDYSKQSVAKIMHSTGLELLDPTAEPIKQSKAMFWPAAAQSGGPTNPGQPGEEESDGDSQQQSQQGRNPRAVTRTRIPPHRRSRPMLMRQNLGEEDALKSAVRMLDHADVLEQALGFSVVVTDEIDRNGHLVDIYAGLSQAYSAEAMYRRSLHAFDLALAAAKKTHVGKEGRVQLLLGQTELKHHRYERAVARLAETSQKYVGQLDQSEVLALRGASAWVLLLTRNPGEALIQSGLAFNASGRSWAAGLLDADDLQATCANSLAPPADGSFDPEGATLALMSAALAGRRSAPMHPLQRKDEQPALGAQALQGLEACVAGLWTDADGYAASDLSAASASALDALGYTELALGWPERAVRQHRLALRRRSPPMLQKEGLTMDAAALSQTLLFLGMAEFAAGRPEKGRGTVQQLLELSIAAKRVPPAANAAAAEEDAAPSTKAAATHQSNSTSSPAVPQQPLSAEVVTWLVNFAKVHCLPSARERVQDFGVHLYERAFEILNRTDPVTPATTILMAKHLKDQARFLIRLSPPRYEATLRAGEQALALQQSASSAGQQNEEEDATLVSMLGASFQGLGQSQEAIGYFAKARDSLLLRLKRSQPPKGSLVAEVLAAYANLAAAKFHEASRGGRGGGLDSGLVKSAMAEFREALRLGKSLNLKASHPRIRSLQSSLANVERIAHRKGALATCPSAKLDFIFGPSTSRAEEQ